MRSWLLARVRRFKHRRRIRATRFGRDSGWHVEFNGEVVAVLTDPRFHDMFWDSYRLEIVTADVELRQRMQTVEFWTIDPTVTLTWRSREFGDVVDHAFAGGDSFREPGRLIVRGLYLL